MLNTWCNLQNVFFHRLCVCATEFVLQDAQGPVHNYRRMHHAHQLFDSLWGHSQCDRPLCVVLDMMCVFFLCSSTVCLLFWQQPAWLSLSSSSCLELKTCMSWRGLTSFEVHWPSVCLQRSNHRHYDPQFLQSWTEKEGPGVGIYFGHSQSSGLATSNSINCIVVKGPTSPRIVTDKQSHLNIREWGPLLLFPSLISYSKLVGIFPEIPGSYLSFLTYFRRVSSQGSTGPFQVESPSPGGNVCPKKPS
jgi:hypothetical protein